MHVNIIFEDVLIADAIMVPVEHNGKRQSGVNRSTSVLDPTVHTSATAGPHIV